MGDKYGRYFVVAEVALMSNKKGKNILSDCQSKVGENVKKWQERPKRNVGNLSLHGNSAASVRQKGKKYGRKHRFDKMGIYLLDV